MRQGHCTITPAVVRATARQALHAALPWRRYGRRVTAGKLLDLLLLAAALAASLSAVVRRFRFGFCHETARQAVHANLPDLGRLTDGLADALHRFAGRRLRRRRWVVAFDLHFCPFYGRRDTPGLVGGQKKQGTQYFYGYATAVLVHRRHRYTVGLVALTGKPKPHEVVAALLAQRDARGLKRRGLVLDSGFDSGDVLLPLQARGLSCAVPLRRKGSGVNRRNAAWRLAAGAVTEVAWVTENSRRPVRTQAVVWQRRAGKTMVVAFGGWGAAAARSELRRAALAKRWYRRRFGIETSYRQLNQCKASTTAKDVRSRLLLVGLGLVLRQVWVWLAWQAARAWGLGPRAWVAGLPLARLAEWLAELLRRQYPEERSIPLGTPLLPLDDLRL